MEFLQKKFQDIDLLERAMKENQDRLEILAANSERLTTGTKRAGSAERGKTIKAAK